MKNTRREGQFCYFSVALVLRKATFVSLNSVFPQVNQLFAVVPAQAHLHLKCSKREPVSFKYALS